MRLIGIIIRTASDIDHITSSPRRSNKGARFPPMYAAIRSAKVFARVGPLAPITWHQFPGIYAQNKIKQLDFSAKYPSSV
ncbi:MAG: hypothetical protein U0787_12830 [Polyangia bacterium]